MKSKTQYVCQQCGATSPKWIGRCPSCQQWNTFVEERITAAAIDAPASWDSSPIRFTEITGGEAPRVQTGIAEFDRVLGGGVVAGALVLLGGDPGVGKSTLMLDVASHLAESFVVLYASGEESAHQIKLRGERLSIRTTGLHIYAEMSVERILAAAEHLKAKAVIIDSIQTTFSEKLEMAPGSIGQVREVASQLLFWTKKNHVPVFLIGHITKDGAIAGPKALEHIVDTVLYFEGPRQHPHRVVRTIKNRFGPAHELGIFEMASTGLKPVEKPSALFLSQTESMKPGSVVLCSMEGSRPLLIEIQALVSRTHFGTPRRLATGVDPQRLALVAAVLEKRVGVNLWDQDIYLNVAGGLQVEEPAADLAIVGSILSSLFNRPVGASTVIFGEVGLGGEIRPAMFPEIRLKEAATLGFTRGIVPSQSVAPELHSAMETVRVRDLREAQEALFS
ncbi:MAG: DNA repair protein RadA [Acidobacteria bacterium]|nr:MAG: DNA repair protein RadA [Acidobacteriota bacterium]